MRLALNIKVFYNTNLMITINIIVKLKVLKIIKIQAITNYNQFKKSKKK